MVRSALAFSAALLAASCCGLPARGQDAARPAAAATAAPAKPDSAAPAKAGPAAAPQAALPAAGGTPAKPAAAPSTGAQSAGAKPDTLYHLLGFALNGTKRVDTDALVATLPQHEGDTITRTQINDDAERIRLVLKARHVHGDMTTATLEREGPGHYIWVIWDVHPVDALSFVARRGKKYLASQSFSGNSRLTAAQLTAATGLHTGDPLPDGALGDARTGIEQSYDKVLQGASVAVKGKVKLRPDNTVIVDWQITEPK